jgi:hypothetical protein
MLCEVILQKLYKKREIKKGKKTKEQKKGVKAAGPNLAQARIRPTAQPGALPKGYVLPLLLSLTG